MLQSKYYGLYNDIKKLAEKLKTTYENDISHSGNCTPF